MGTSMRREPVQVRLDGSPAAVAAAYAAMAAAGFDVGPLSPRTKRGGPEVGIFGDFAIVVETDPAVIVIVTADVARQRAGESRRVAGGRRRSIEGR